MAPGWRRMAVRSRTTARQIRIRARAMLAPTAGGTLDIAALDESSGLAAIRDSSERVTHWLGAHPPRLPELSRRLRGPDGGSTNRRSLPDHEGGRWHLAGLPRERPARGRHPHHPDAGRDHHVRERGRARQPAQHRSGFRCGRASHPREVPAAGEPQGESVCFVEDGYVTVSEGVAPPVWYTAENCE